MCPITKRWNLEKLNFKYRDEIVLFPFLRLGKFSDVSEAYLRSQPCYKQSVCLCLASLCIDQNSRGWFFFFSPSICPGEWVQKSTALLLVYVLFWFGVARTSEEDGFLEG